VKANHKRKQQTLPSSFPPYLVLEQTAVSLSGLNVEHARLVQHEAKAVGGVG